MINKVSQKDIILIVDDSQENISALRSMLEVDYTVYSATNGKAALRILEKLMPDLILLDVVMPEIDGFEILRKLKENIAFFHVPVIFITSDTGIFSEARGLLLGAVDYIAKPYNPDIVRIKVKNQLENKHHRDNLENLVEQRTIELIETQNTIIFGMSLMAESRDFRTGEHLKRIQFFVNILGQAIHNEYPLLLGAQDLQRIVMLSPLHDIGKVMVSDNILLKPGKLTETEFQIIKEHTTNGADILRKTRMFLQNGGDVLEEAVLIAECHHEKFDGSGYPFGLLGSQIPLSARIIALADVYDALTSIRSYKKAYTHDMAVDIIFNGDENTKPSHFDPLVLDVFRSISSKFCFY